MAFPADWQYRKSITLSRASGAVTNYQKKILVSEAASSHITDNFNRSNSSPVDGNWATLQGSGIKLVSNGVRGIASNAYGVSVRSETFSPDQYATITFGNVVSLGDYHALVVRGHLDGGLNYYVWQKDATSATTYYMQKVLNGTDTAIATITGGPSSITYPRQRLAVIGSKITVAYWTGSEWINFYSVQDTSITHGAPGLRDYNVRVDDNYRMDDFECGDVTDVGCGGHCKTDFSDLRFTAADGITLLDYYIEDVTGTTPNQIATVWVEFDSIGTGATTFYMYYGNAAATAVSSGPNTFILFEDFNALSDGNLNGQNGWSGHTDWQVATTTKYEGAKAVQSAGGGATCQISKAISSGAETLYHLFAQMRMRHSQVSTGNCLDIYLSEGTSQITAIAISMGQFVDLVYPPSWPNIGLAPSNDTWYKVVLGIDSAGTHKTLVDDVEYSAGAAANMINVSSTINKIVLEQYVAGGAALVDQIMIGYYLPTGPIWGTWGSEESLGGGGGAVMNSHFFVMLLAGGGR
jgi:hypothetical protein